MSATKNPNFKLIRFEKILPLRLLKTITFVALAVAVFSVLILAAGFFFTFNTSFIIRLIYLSSAIFLVSLILTTFSKFGIRNKGKKLSDLGLDEKTTPPPKAEEFLNFDSALILKPFIKKDSLPSKNFLKKLFNFPRFKFVWYRLGLDPKMVLNNALAYIGDSSINLDELLTQAFKNAASNKHRQILPHDILSAYFKIDSNLSKSFFDINIQEDELLGALEWENMFYGEIEAESRFWELNQLLYGRGMGRFLPYGFTSNLNDFSKDITTSFETNHPHLHIIGHKKDINAIESVLARKGENNVLLIGEPGTGRHTTVYGFTQRILKGHTERKLRYKRIIELDAQKLLSGLNTPGEIQERLDTILFEAIKAGNIILVVDNFQEFVASTGKIGTANLSQIFMKYMETPKFQLIALADMKGFHEHIENNLSLMRLFEKIEIKEATPETTIKILEYTVPTLEARYNVFILYQTLVKAVELAEFTGSELPYPEKAINTLESALSACKDKKIKVLSAEALAEILTEKTGIPLGAAEKQEEKDKLLNLETLMHERLIDQKEAVVAIAESLRRTRAGLTEKNRPIGNFLFMGPTGVGKTETARTLAAIYFGDEDKMIRLDMSEYQSEDGADRLIGTKDQGDISPFLNQVREKPFSLILLDEIEKAHSGVLNLFLQILDEGRLTDAEGRHVSFINNIIIGTSNAGAEFIREAIKQNKSPAAVKDELIDLVIKQNLFRPEFLNRFDAVIVFKPLSESEMAQVAELMLKGLALRIKEQGYEFKANPGLVQYLVKVGFDPVFGARAMRRALNEKIEGVVAKKILAGQYQKGDIIEINPGELN
jgi:ATP-dependent Clp protease ATP-binding subunit ClpC